MKSFSLVLETTRQTSSTKKTVKTKKKNSPEIKIKINQKNENYNAFVFIVGTECC